MLVCRHCAASIQIPARCPHCNGVSLRGRGRGIDHVRSELQDVGFTTLTPDDGLAQRPGTIEVLTAARTYDLAERAYDCIVVTRYESLLAIPRPDADERARRMLILLASYLKTDGTLVVQGSSTHRTEIEVPDDGTWRTKTIEIRDRFGYPPAWKVWVLRQRLVPARVRSVSPNEVLRKLSSSPHITVTPPQRSRGRSAQNPSGTMLIIRSKKELPSDIRNYLMSLDEQWSITVNPIEIA